MPTLILSGRADQPDLGQPSNDSKSALQLTNICGSLPGRATDRSWRREQRRAGTWISDTDDLPTAAVTAAADLQATAR